MSKQNKTNIQKITLHQLNKLYHSGERITAITAYDYTMAKIVDASGVDIVLVGDSLGMVVQGNENTLPVDIDHVVYHTKCVAKGIGRAHVMADMPFMSYQSGLEAAVNNAGKLIKAGAESIKLEGGDELEDLVWYLNKIGIPVMAHIGLRPQSIHQMGGYRVQGRSKSEAEKIMHDAHIMQEAGAFALLLEGIPMEVAGEITQSVSIPTIGISSGPHCSGQVLVVNDILGMDPDFNPKFVKKYFDFYSKATKSIQAYSDDVKNGSFPTEKHSFHQNVVAVKKQL